MLLAILASTAFTLFIGLQSMGKETGYTDNNFN
jgi:hypothetical protein